jgi:hypothetical protein
MSLNGISSGYSRPMTPQTTGTSPLRDQGATRPQVAPGVARPTAPAPGALLAPTTAPGAANALPVEPPAGTDPELWSVLSAEERGFFAKAGAMGPLTYGRMMSEGATQPAMAAVRGGRLDIRA